MLTSISLSIFWASPWNHFQNNRDLFHHNIEHQESIFLLLTHEIADLC